MKEMNEAMQKALKAKAAEVLKKLEGAELEGIEIVMHLSGRGEKHGAKEELEEEKKTKKGAEVEDEDVEEEDYED